jgi:hypothetical protein
MTGSSTPRSKKVAKISLRCRWGLMRTCSQWGESSNKEASHEVADALALSSV